MYLFPAPPDSARTGYATERALLIYTQLSTDAVSALRKFWVLIRLETTQRRSTLVNRRHVRPGKKNQKKIRLGSNDFGCICAGVSNVGGYKRNVWYNLSCELFWPSGKALGW